MKALRITRIENIKYALGHLPGCNDFERLRIFCDEHNIRYDFSQDED